LHIPESGLELPGRNDIKPAKYVFLPEREDAFNGLGRILYELLFPLWQTFLTAFVTLWLLSFVLRTLHQNNIRPSDGQLQGNKQ
jgi:hypothetical protein